MAKEKFLTDIEILGKLNVSVIENKIGDFLTVSNLDNKTITKRTALQLLSDIGASPLNHTHTFSSLTSKPTNLKGFGITDANDFPVYNFTNGVLIETILTSANSQMFLIDVKGNSYTNGEPIDFTIQFYSDTTNSIIKASSVVYRSGAKVLNLTIFRFNNKIYVYFKQPSLYTSYFIKCRQSVEASVYNAYTEISDSIIPTSGVTLSVSPTENFSYVRNSEQSTTNYIPKFDSNGNVINSSIVDNLNFVGFSKNIVIGKSFGRASFGNQSSDGDTHFGSSGAGSPPTGTTQEYGFYSAYNAFRDEDGFWKHSRKSTVKALKFSGGHHLNGFSWDFSENVGSNSISWTNVMNLDATGNLFTTGSITAIGSLISDQLQYNRSMLTTLNLDLLVIAGFYSGTNLTNAPTSGYFHISVERHTHNDLWVKQVATSYGTGNIGNITYTRTRENNVWKPWKKNLTDLDIVSDGVLIPYVGATKDVDLNNRSLKYIRDFSSYGVTSVLDSKIRKYKDVLSYYHTTYPIGCVEMVLPSSGNTMYDMDIIISEYGSSSTTLGSMKVRLTFYWYGNYPHPSNGLSSQIESFSSNINFSKYTFRVCASPTGKPVILIGSETTTIIGFTSFYLSEIRLKYGSFNDSVFETATNYSINTGVTDLTGYTNPIILPLESPATKLYTPRNINGIPFDGTQNITITDATKEPILTKGNLLATATDILLTGSGTGSLIGNNVTIGLSTAVKTDIAKGVTAFGYGNHAGLYSLLNHTHTFSDISGVLLNAQFSGSYTGLVNLTGSGNVDFAKFLGNASDTALLPSFSFTGDDNTGIWRPLADQLGFSTGGVNRLTISTTGIISTLAITAPTFSGALSGNATTATTLQTARLINGVSFNGSANITIADATKEPILTKGNLLATATDILLTGSGTGSLIGNNVTIGLSTAVKTDIAKGVTAFGWGDSATKGYAKDSEVIHKVGNGESITRTLVGWSNSTNSNPQNYINEKIFSFDAGNSSLAIFGDGTTNSRRFGMQVGHYNPAFSSSYGDLELNPYGGNVRINSKNISGVVIDSWNENIISDIKQNSIGLLTLVRPNTTNLSVFIDTIKVKDARSNTEFPNSDGSGYYMPKPVDSILNNSITSLFTYDWGGNAGWGSVVNIKGWAGDYASWQISGGGTNSIQDGFFFRNGVGETWEQWQKVWTSKEFTQANVDSWNNTVTATTTTTINNDWDSITVNGNYYNSIIGAIGIPEGATGMNVSHIENNSGATQIANRVGANKMWFRKRQGTVWSTWTEVAGLDSPTFRGTVTSPTFSGALSGNATTATTLQTARLINGVSFNGSANITIADATKEPILTKGNLLATATDILLTGSGTGSLIGNNITIGLATAVKTDIAKGVTAFGYGNHAGLYSLLNHTHTFSNISGVLLNAQFSGSYTGLINLTGSGNVDFAKFLGNASDTALLPSFSFTGDDNTGIWRPLADQLGFSTGGVNRLTISTTGIISTLPITAPTFSGALSGNATTATTLQTARLINGVSFNGSANITIADATKEPAFGKNSAFNKNFGSVAGTVSEGNHNHDNDYVKYGEKGIPVKTDNDYLVTKIGSTAESLDFNLITGAGFYKNMANVSSLNSPTSGYWYVENLLYGNGNMTQYAHPYRISDGYYMRTKYSDSWTAWVEILHSGRFGLGVNDISRGNHTHTFSDISGVLLNAQFSGSYTGLVNLTGSGNVDFAKFLGNASDTALLPSFSFTGDDNTGIWRPLADQLGFSTGGVNRLTISTTDISSTLPITAPTFSGALSGNATTATTLQTARLINGVSFNGSANITIADATKEPILTKGNLLATATDILLTGSGTGSLIGNNVTIGLSTAVKTDIAKGVTAFGYGNHAGLYSLLNHTHTLDEILSVNSESTKGITLKGSTSTGFIRDVSYSGGGWARSLFVGTNSNYVGKRDFLMGFYGSATDYVYAYLGFEAYNSENMIRFNYNGDITIGSNKILHAGLYGTVANTVAQGNDSRILNGQTAFGYGNHATFGYLKVADIASKVNNSLILTAGNGLTGGGNLTANRSFAIDSKFSPQTAQILGSSIDLNTLTEGFYAQNSNAQASNGINYPTPLAGTLNVFKSAGVTQTYMTYTTSPDYYFRTIYGASISPWRKIWHDGNFNPLSYVSEVGITNYNATGSSIGTKVIKATTSTPTNSMGTNSFGIGMHFEPDVTNIKQLVFDADGTLWSRNQKANVWGGWNRILNEPQLEGRLNNKLDIDSIRKEIVTNFDYHYGFKILQSTGGLALNSPKAGQSANGIQFSTNDDSDNTNQLVFSLDGDLFTRTQKEGDGFNEWEEIITTKNKNKQIELGVGTAFTYNNSWNGNTIIISSNCTIAIPTSSLTKSQFVFDFWLMPNCTLNFTVSGSAGDKFMFIGSLPTTLFDSTEAITGVIQRRGDTRWLFYKAG